MSNQLLAAAGLQPDDESDTDVPARKRLRRSSEHQKDAVVDGTGVDTATTDLVSAPKSTTGRQLRLAAIVATISWRESHGPQWGSATRRPRRRDKAAAVSEGGDERDWVEALLNCLVDRKVDADGTVFYRADWVDYDREEDRYTWVPVKNLQGHEHWMELVDLWKAKHEGTRTFSAFVKSNAKAIRIGAGEGMRCFFNAVHAVQRILSLPDFDVNAAETQLTAKGWDFAGGVKKNTLIPLMEALCKAGLGLNYMVWNKNLHETTMGGGALGIATAARESGVYMVFTIDPRRLGHCWVLHQDE